MDDGTAIPIQNAAQVIKRPTHVDIGNIDMPVLVSGVCRMSAKSNFTSVELAEFTLRTPAEP
jgi:hypothetical protein